MTTEPAKLHTFALDTIGREVWKEMTKLLRYEKFGWKCDNNSKGQEEPGQITGETKG
jgi:hypothetical protein